MATINEEVLIRFKGQDDTGSALNSVKSRIQSLQKENQKLTKQSIRLFNSKYSSKSYINTLFHLVLLALRIIFERPILLTFLIGNPQLSQIPPLIGSPHLGQFTIVSSSRNPR